MSKFSLHQVTKENAKDTLPEVLRLVKALALFEKAPDAVEATEELLYDSFFGTDKNPRYCEGILVYDNAAPGPGVKAIAMAVYFYTFSTWTGRGGLYLEDLYVEEEYRGKGISKLLFKRLGEITQEKGLPRMDWVVLDWNKPARDVYSRMGGREQTEWIGVRLQGEALKKLAASA